jgi:hypothetical protein
MGLMSERPPIQFDLGARVAFTQRACVARKQLGEWSLLEGVKKREHVPHGAPSVDDEKINKTVHVWDEEGSGVVIGLVKRGIGTSVAGYSMTDDFEQGWFEPREWRWLYAVRRQLQGTDYILVPVESARLA